MKATKNDTEQQRFGRTTLVMKAGNPTFIFTDRANWDDAVDEAAQGFGVPLEMNAAKARVIRDGLWKIPVSIAEVA
jgi:hypothetical protein